MKKRSTIIVMPEGLSSTILGLVIVLLLVIAVVLAGTYLGAPQ